MKTENEIREKIKKYGRLADKTYDYEYMEAMASIHILRWTLNEVYDAT